MAFVVFYCAHCSVGYASIGDKPARCPSCDRVTRWVTALPQAMPTKEYAITVNDARFLASIKIAAEVES